MVGKTSPMKKIVLKTAFITLGVALILAVSIFGIASLCAPITMMKLTASLGMQGISGDYAFQEYERSGDIDCLARSFVISAEQHSDRTANDRFTIFYGLDGFSSYCEAQAGIADNIAGFPVYSYRAYICGLEACVKYRLAESDEGEDEAIAFALSETAESFPSGNPVVALSVEAVKREDKAFCERILSALRGAALQTESADYQNMIKILEEATHE